MTKLELFRLGWRLRNALQDTYIHLLKLKTAIESLDDVMEDSVEEDQVDNAFGSKTDLSQVWFNRSFKMAFYKLTLRI